MKKEETLKKAFRNLREGLKRQHNGEGIMTPQAISVLITLAWILDLLPPRSDELNTMHMLGDIEVNRTKYADGHEVSEAILTAEV